MKINKFNESINIGIIYWKTYNSKDNSYLVKLLEDIDFLNKSNIVYQFFYQDYDNWYLYAFPQNSKLLNNCDYLISVYTSIKDCFDDMINHNYKKIDIEKIILIHNTNKFNL